MGATTDSELLNYTVNGASVLDFFAEFQGLLDTATASVTTLTDAFALFDDATVATTTAAVDLDDVVMALREGFATLDASLAGSNASLSEIVAATDQTTLAVEQNTVATEENAVATDAASTARRNSASSFKPINLGLLEMVGGFLLAKGVLDSIKGAGNFEAGLTTLVTSAGEARSSLKLVGDGILQMSVDTATSTKELVSGMYMIESSGIHGAAGLLVLKAAAEGAKAENAKLGDMANATTSILSSYGLSADQAAFAVNVLVATTASGKMHMQDLAASISNVIPTASTAGISIQQVGAALATMTMQGTSADQAATFLRQTIVSLEAPGKKAKDTLTAIGLSSDLISRQLKRKPDGFIDAIQQINTALDKKFPDSAKIAEKEMAKVTSGQETMDEALANLAQNTSPGYIEALKNIAGGSKTMQGLLQLTGTHLEDLRTNFDNITTAANKSKDGIAGWSDVQKTFNFQLGVAHDAFDALLIKVGRELLPMLETFLSTIVLPAIQHFQEWATQTTGLHDTFKTVVDVMGTLITDVEHLVQTGADLVAFFQQAGPQGTILKEALIGIGAAVGAIKLVDLIAGLKALATDNLTKLGFLKGSITDIGTETATSAAAVTTETAIMDTDFKGVGVAAVTSAGVEGIGAIGPAAEAAAGLVTTQSALMKTALGGVGLGLAAFGMMGMIKDTFSPQETQAILDKMNKIPPVVTVTVAVDTKQATRDLQAYEKLVKDFDGTNTPGPVVHWPTPPQQSIKDIQEYERQWADLSNLKPFVPQVNPIYVNDADAKVKALIAHFQQTSGPFTPVIDTTNVDKTQEKVDKLKKGFFDTQGPYSPIVDTKSVDDAKIPIATLKQRLLDAQGPYKPIVDTASIDNAHAQATFLKNYLHDLSTHSYTVNVTTDFTQSGAPPTGRPTQAHAFGGFGLSKGWSTTGETGVEGVYVPSGADIMPHNSFATIMDSIPRLGQAVNSLVSQRSHGGSSGGSGGITINGDVHLHGVQNVQQLWQALNEYGGASLEHGLSVGTVGM